MPLKLDLGLKLANNILQNKEISNFIQELSNTLKDNNVLVYKDYDSSKFTRKNEEKLWDKKEELIREHINKNNMNGADENKLYEISYESSKGFNVIEYDKTYENRISFIVDYIKLPKNVKEGMFFRKVDENYILDKETTEKIYNEMISFQNELILNQKEVLNNMRQEGAIYKVTYLEDDCEDWRTELTNQQTGETFQELEFPHDVYHQVGVDSLVKYENGKYSVVEGTGIFDLYSNNVKNYCEIEDKFITPNGKIGYNEFYSQEKNDIHKTIKNIIEKFTNFAIERLTKSIKEIINKFRQNKY